MREFRQNTSYKDIMNQTAEEGETEVEESGAGGHGNRYSLPYGLCESVGINTYGMTPREAWDAWMSKTGRTKEDAEREHWGKEASEKNAKKSPASVEKNKENELNATDEQRKIIDKISERFAVGKNGTMRYGGDYATIVEAPTFSRLENGDIEYRVVGVREIPAQKSYVIGVGDTEAKTRTTISTGKIKQGGLIINNRNEVTEETGVKKPDKQPDQAKETPASASVEATSAPVQKTEEQTADAPKDRTFTATRHGVNEELARRSREMNSFSDYKNGSATAGYNSDVQRFENNVNELIEHYKSNDTLTEEDWERVEAIAEQYSSNLAKYTDESNRVEASYPSWFIAGPARYNTRKNDAKYSRLSSLYQENENRLDPDKNVYLDKIKGILSNRAIASNDSNAIGKLQKKYDDLKAELENGKAMNAYFRKNKTLVGFPGISEESAKAFDANNASGDFFARQPFAAYRLQNGNAELRRIQGRIDELKKAQSAAEAAKANPEAAKAATAAKYPQVEGVEVQENAEQMRVQLRFPGKPDDETRTLLKSWGFRWSPTQGAWQRQLNGNGKYAAKQVMSKLANKK